MSRRVLAGVAALALLPGASAAYELDRGALRLELIPSLRLLGTFTRELDAEAFLLDGRTTRSDSGLALVRLRLDAQAVWRDRLYAQVVYDNELRSGSALDSLRFALGDAIGNRTWFDWDDTVSSHDDGDWRHLIYRAWVRSEWDRLEVTLGRQRIPLGRGRLWNPIDLFNAIPPLAIQGDQRIGVDAARLRVRLARELWAEGIWAPQDDPDDHRAAARIEIARTAVDAALTVGRFRRDWVIGADAAGNLGNAAYRLEVTYTNPREGDRFWQAVASLDYTFQLGAGLYALVEHLYNENRVPATIPAPFPAGSFEVRLGRLASAQVPLLDRITTIVRNQTGFQLGYEATPLLRADVLWIYDWHGPSAAVVPVVSWSARDDLVLSAGVQLFYGPGGRSEYGDAANLMFAQIDLFF